MLLRDFLLIKAALRYASAPDTRLDNTAEKGMKRLNYDEINSQLSDWAGICSSSELHGLITGLASVGMAEDVRLLEQVSLRHTNLDACSGQISEAIEAMQAAILAQLENIELSFEALLPDDDEAIHSRVQALGEWCQGFLVGFGTGVKREQAVFSQDAQELLRDLVEISQVGRERGEEPDEEEELAFTELQEYVRTAAMTLFAEFVLAREKQDTQIQPSNDFH